MNKIKKVGIVACSNGLSTSSREYVDNLTKILNELSLKPVFSEYIYAENSVFQGSGEERANALMNFYRNDEITAIYDISGGDIANETILYLDFDVIKNSDKQFWGYSDLTTIINAVYTKTGKKSVLYQVRKLVECEQRKENFRETVMNGKNDLFDFPYEFINGSCMSGIIVGGNIRCLLKLAGTEYFPDLNGKILLLESLGGGILQMTALLSQLKMLGAFEKVSGIMLGTFTKLEETADAETVGTLVKKFAGNIPIAKTQFVGHGSDSYAVEIGRYYSFKENIYEN